MLHYPKGVEWIEVCVMSEGRVDDKYQPGEYTQWWETTCWNPRFVWEEYPFRPGALKVQATLKIRDGEVEELLRTGVINVRPEESGFGIELEAP